MSKFKELNKIFKPKSIAIVGASTNPEKLGHIILKNIIDGGFKGQIYPINPKASIILGLPCWPSLRDVKAAEIDLIVIVVPAKLVKKVIEEAIKKRVSGAVIISGGFREIGNYSLEKSVIETAKKYGIRVIGPNSQGITYTNSNLCASWPLMKDKGKMVIISQSGTIGAAFAGWAEDDNLGLSAFVSIGNKSDVNEVDLISYFSKDISSNVIGMYLEGVRDGRAFMNIGRVTTSKKPIVILKPGRTKKGRLAAQSHTKSIIGNYNVFYSAIKQVGMIRADNVYELYDFCKILSLCKKPKGNRCLIITSSGGSGILATDIAEDSGVNLVKLTKDRKDALSKLLPEQSIIRNPLDLTATNAERYYKIAKEFKGTNNIDIILLIFGDPIPGAANITNKLKNEVSQEIVACYIGGGNDQAKEIFQLHKVGIPTFPTPERAMKAISALIQYSNFQKRNLL